ncbi:MAG: NADH:ubiquinone reductase (Na(+)-transporting) subunit B [Myxococcota bacterium]
MQFLRDKLDEVGKQFEKGGKLEWLYPFYEANDTILFNPGDVTKGTTHVRDAMNLKRMMITVVVALLPIVLWSMFNTGYQASLAVEQGATAYNGWQVDLWQWVGFEFDSGSVIGNLTLGALFFLPVFIMVGVVGGHIEVAFALIRKHEINEGFLVTWFLFALTLPPTIPLWQVALGISFGVIFGKEVFGGTGMNIFNPALTARAFLFFAYPAQISGDQVWTAAQSTGAVDGWSGATWLGRVAADGVGVLDADPNLWLKSFFGLVPGSMGETSTFLCLVGAAILILTKVGSWRTMAGVVLGTAVMTLTLNAIGSDTNPMFALPFEWHVVLGGWAFGMVFMATDPVSSAFTDFGKLLYGFGIGVMVVLVRIVNPAYPEGMMLAILFMNMFAPLVDHFVVQANVKRRKARYGLK